MTQQALDTIRAETVSVLCRHLAPGDRVALLDFPTHNNSGDSLIYAGEAAYLKRLHVRVDYVSDLMSHNDAILRDRVESRTILLHGGGNFGDRWPAHQKFREGIVSRFPNNKIVGLPQGLEYADPEALARTSAIYARHPDLTLLLREQRSYDIAVEHFPANQVEYCPDMAFGTDIAESPGGSDVDVVRLLRVDSEKVDHGTVEFDYSSAQYDWGLAGLDVARWNVLTFPTRVVYNIPRSTRLLYPAIARLYSRLIETNLRAAQRILNMGPVVLTDRLHAAVLAGMMGKQVVALDNANKKISGIHRDYLHRFDNVRFAATTREAGELVCDAVSVVR